MCLAFACGTLQICKLSEVYKYEFELSCFTLITLTLASIDSYDDKFVCVGELDKEEGGEDGESKQEVPTASGVQIKLYTVHPK